jgi:predicted DNA binding CopG/RHH family protein
MKPLPQFKTLEEEWEYWESKSSEELLAESEEVEFEIDAVDTSPKTLISLRLHSKTIEQLKALAGRRGIGYQTMIRMWVMERLEEEARRAKRPQEPTGANTRG